MSDIVVQRAVMHAAEPTTEQLRNWAMLALQERADCGEVVLRVVSSEESQLLNTQYRGREAPTNVLSFVAEDWPAQDESPPLGDVVICAEVVAAQAREQAKRLDAHWAHMVIHGCLHLLGYDHQHDADAERMEQRERALLAQLEFPDPYESITTDDD